MSPASVALLEPKELDLRLDAVEKIETHCESVVVYCRKIVVCELRMQLCARSSDLKLKSGSKIRALKSRRRSVSSVMSSYVALPGVGYLTIGMAQMAFLCWLQLAAVSRCRRSRLAIGSEVAELQNGNGTGNQAKRWWVFGFYSGGSQEMDWSSRAMAIVMNDCGGVGDSRLCLAPVAPEDRGVAIVGRLGLGGVVREKMKRGSSRSTGGEMRGRRGLGPLPRCTGANCRDRGQPSGWVLAANGQRTACSTAISGRRSELDNALV